MGASPFGIIDALAARADSSPDRLAFAVEGREITFGRLERDARAVAALLAGEGLRQGDRCALLLPTSLDFLRALFAVQSLGAAPVAMDPALPLATIARRLARLRCRVAIGDGQLVDALAGDGLPRPVRRSALLDLPPPLPRNAVAMQPSDIAYLQLTSGTAGEPRGAMVPHASLDASLRHARSCLGVREDDVLVSWLPLHHDFGLVRFAFGPVYFGCASHLLAPSLLNLDRWLRTISEVRGTITGAPDTGYRIAARMVSPEGLDLSSLRIAGSGGEPVRASTIRDFEARFGVPGVVRPGYGLAEATLTVTVDLQSRVPPCDAKGNVSCGPAVPGIQVRIVDEAGRSLPPGEPGEILIRGETLFSGYFDDPDATAEALRDGWLHSGDLGALDREGRLYVHGRRRALIKRAGGTIAPREVEEAADAVRGVRWSAAVGVPNPSLFDTEDVVVVAEVRRGDLKDEAAMAEAARTIARRAEQAVGTPPWRVLLVAPNTIPRTANGKIRHERLRIDVVAGTLREGSLLHEFRS